MPTSPLRLALAQLAVSSGDPAANARAAATAIATAADRGAHLVAFPELCLTGYDLPMLARSPGAWMTAEDPRLDPVRHACASTGLFAITSAPLAGAEGAGFIAAPVIGPRGDVGISLKEHLHGSEADMFRAGAPLAPFEVNGWRVSVGICFDAAHPRHAERAAKDGADLYVGTALYVRGEERRSDLHFGARAMDNRVFAALANYAGTTGGYVSCGLSGVWGPSGDVVERVPDARETIRVVELDHTALARYRR